MPYELPQLRFGYADLEPYFSEKTVRAHHQIHNQAYTDAINGILAKHPELEGQTVERLLRSIPDLPDNVREDVRFYGGGHANHQFMWKVIGPADKHVPSGPLAEHINRTFGSFAGFQEKFRAAAASLQGDGWVFLSVDKWGPGELVILSLPKNDSVLPLGKPGVLICDLWAHAREPEYRTLQDYLDAYFQIVDWDVCEKRYEGFVSGAMKI